jgi:ATP-dependent DNA helicase RecQ
MLAQVVTLHFDSALGGFDDSPLQAFLKDKEVHSIHDHFFIKDQEPYLAVVVTYTLHHSASSPSVKMSQTRKEPAWRERLTEADMPLFNTLRNWRMERCKQDGVPPYVICSNQQFADMVRERPQSLSQLGAIKGFGQNKLKQYGRDILAILAEGTTVPATNGLSTTPEESADDPSD